MRLLIIDDEPALLRALSHLLEEQQIAVDTAQDGETGLDMARTRIYDLLVIDVMLPVHSGPDIVKMLRREKDPTPILLLTARDAVHDRVQGLDSGADDYLSKPFRAEELLARVRALTRRLQSRPSSQPIRAYDFAIDVHQHTATYKGHPLPLTQKEYQLLVLFIRNPAQTLSRDLLWERLWGHAEDRGSSSLETLIHMLRRQIIQIQQKLDEPTCSPIETIRGFGYRFRGL